MKQRLIKTVLNNNDAIIWSTLQKCTLILILACCMHFTWMIWKLYIFLNPELCVLINCPLLRLTFWVDITNFCLFAILIYPSTYCRHHKWAESIIPWLTIGWFTIILCYNSYLIGTLSPATMVGYVSFVEIGLVLFQRLLIYLAMMSASLMLLISTYLSTMHVIPYAPLFNLSETDIDYFTESFWVGSMLFFSAPIFLICLIVFEILLTQWRNREKYIQHLSQIDPLTNVLNRRSINLCLQELHKQQQEQQYGYAIILLDLDHFKRINDDYGHHIGDEVLIEVANCLSSHLRDQDNLGRFGGEEFILLLPSTSLEQAKNIAERCRIAIQKLIISIHDHSEIRISASFGVSISQQNCAPQEILNQADQAMYAVKAMGRNQVQCFIDLPKYFS